MGTTVVFFQGERHIYDADADAAAAIREYGAHQDEPNDAALLHAVRVIAVRAANSGKQAEIMVTHLP